MSRHGSGSRGSSGGYRKRLSQHQHVAPHVARPNYPSAATFNTPGHTTTTAPPFRPIIPQLASPPLAQTIAVPRPSSAPPSAAPTPTLGGGMVPSLVGSYIGSSLSRLGDTPPHASTANPTHGGSADVAAASGTWPTPTHDDDANAGPLAALPPPPGGGPPLGVVALGVATVCGTLLLARRRPDLFLPHMQRIAALVPRPSRMPPAATRHGNATPS